MFKRIFVVWILMMVPIVADDPILFDVNYPWMTDIREYLAWNDSWGSARAVGMSGAVSALSENVEGAILNPAALGLMKHTSLDFSLNYRKNQSDFNYNGTDNSNSINRFSFSSLGMIYIYPVYRGSVVMSFGYQKLKDFTQSQSFSGYTSGVQRSQPNLYEENSEDKRGYLGSLYFSTAVQVTPNVYLGGTLNFLSGEYNYNFDIERQDPQNVYGLMNYIRKFDTQDDLSGFNFVLGGLYTMNDKWRFSMAFTSPSWIKVDEEIRQYLFAEDLQNYYGWYDNNGNIVWFESEYDYRIQLPMKVNFGIGYKDNNLAVGLDLNFSDYTQLDYNRDPFEGFNHTRRISKIYQSSWGMALGAEYFFPESIMFVLGGVQYQTIPYKYGREAYINATNDLEIASAKGNDDKLGFSAGFGVVLDKSLRWNLVYQHETYQVGENLLTEKYTFNQFVTGITFRF
ncbi:MAG: outer membrane protein transport protein [Candidatus Delongbacteria bacterium]|nr:outer membrane protein transport protein [Candidatus Delongbacteria bacterium]